MSGVGCIEDETHHVHELVEATTAEARSVRDEVQSRVATLVALADTSASHIAEEIEGCVRKVVAYSDAQASRIAVEVTQRLESEIVVAASSTTTTANIMMHTAVEGVRRDI